ncbi:MAG: EpsG family protein [Bacteroidales bacterium]
MDIYIIFFTLLAIVSVANQQSKNVGRYIIALFLFILIGCRDNMVGPDTESYIDYFLQLSQCSLMNLKNDSIFIKEPLFALYTWCLCFVSSEYWFYLLVSSIFPVVAIYRTLKIYNKSGVDNFISILTLFVLGIASFFMSGMRQTMAMSIVLYAYPTFCNRENIKFIIFVVIASLFHNSAILFLLCYVARYMTLDYKNLVYVIVAAFMGTVVSQGDIQHYVSLIFSDRFSIYGDYHTETLSYSGFFIQLFLFSFCYAFRNNLKDNESHVIMNIVTFGLIFQAFSTVLAEMFRLSMYFSLFYIILIPRAINCNTKFRSMLKIAFVSIFLVYLFFISSTYLPNFKSALI